MTPTPLTTPFYDPLLSYEENYERGPFGYFAQSASLLPVTLNHQFMGQPVRLPFGIPAGPLLNSRFVKAAFAYGFDLCVYKTVRSTYRKSHNWPNVLAIHPEGKLTHDKQKVKADGDYSSPPLSITNSFGVPSFMPEVWQADMAEAVKAAGPGQLLIGSFQGTAGERSVVDDYGYTALLVAETGVKVLEANLSCPNEGSQHLLCFDTDKVRQIVEQIKAHTTLPLILKMAYFDNDHLLQELLEKVGGLVEGFSTINTIPAQPVDEAGRPALIDRAESGVCGDAIRWAGLDMVSRLARLRESLGQSFSIVGVGGVNTPEHYQQYRQAGADAVMSATGAMWNPLLAQELLATGFASD